MANIDNNYGWEALTALPLPWQEIVRALRAKVSPVAALLYGSRLPGWPEPPLEQSDYDLILVVPEGRRREYRGYIPGRVDGPKVDLTVLTCSGVRSSQILSPEYHVMERYGLKLGDWSWYEPGVPLSWLGADNTLEMLQTGEEAERAWTDNGPDYAARWAVKITRGALLLRHAIGDIDNLPGWGDVARRYGLPEELVKAARTDAGWPEEKTARLWGKKALKAARKALRETKKAVAAYPRNVSDAEFRAHRDAELAQAQ
ncbi:MAG TPA: nucleotidyltransferase domain-containing protein [Spirochaetia bacterium]|nr:nucleotidyltransferase domain-containing protein [Spirochaetia bacterium]